MERLKNLGVSPDSLLEAFARIFEFLPLRFGEALERREGDVERVFVDLFVAADFGWLFIQEIKGVLGIDGFVLDDFEVDAKDYGIWFFLEFGAGEGSKLAFDDVYIEVGDGVRVVYSKTLELGLGAVKKLKKAIDEAYRSGYLDAIYGEGRLRIAR